ncbi:hypothetical protein SA2016_1873 [Sinomonas atrocyanea]|uniref:Uncharacterized protein n=1 Tax=Sinomonas atrocyanea TaxID=37927 RepID=A0A127A028_9MICC|nr:hypothetical protein [Sinomonas atrocyanea]AMM32547.1 hypothetical protein SA2016_1873 [Sinomonas atrocyanea]GEB62585.1 hypothetical protein SAT01_00330 [Sinomonas atrocyanea]GGG72279.1 hypothetical protein GCM10007172_25880 [Sinomonas atrocyanea]
MENKALRIVFPVFLGVLLALLIGFGLQAVYPQPESPSPGYEAPYEAYLASLQAYERIAAAVLSGLAVVLLAAGSLLPARAAALAEGLLLGGVFTLIYAAARGSGAGPGLPAAPAVGAVGVGLVLALAALFLRQSGRLPRLRERRAEAADETALAVVFPLAAAPLAATVVSLGLQAFYPPPVLSGYSGPGYPGVLAVYERNAGLIGTAAAAVLILVGFALLRRASIPADALLLGGVVTLVVASAGAISPKTTLVSLGVGVLGLLGALATGHLRLGAPLRRGTGAAATGSRVGSRVFSVLHPVAVGALSVVVFFVGVFAFYPPPEDAEPSSEWLRTVSLSATVVAVVFLLASLVLERRAAAVGNALVVGGLLTLVAGVAPAAVAGEQGVVFVALAVAVAVVLFVGYRRFVRGVPRAPRDTRPPGTPPAVPPVPPAPAG